MFCMAASIPFFVIGDAGKLLLVLANKLLTCACDVLPDRSLTTNIRPVLPVAGNDGRGA